MLNNYRNLEKQYHKKITSIVVYCGGGITYEDAWTLSPQQFEMLDDTVNDKVELMVKLAKASLI